MIMLDMWRLKVWRGSRGLALVALLVALAMVLIIVGAMLRPHSTFAAFAPQFSWFCAGVLVGLRVATDVLAERLSGSSKNH